MNKNNRAIKIFKSNGFLSITPSLMFTLTFLLGVKPTQEINAIVSNLNTFGDFILKPITFFYFAMFYVLFLLLGEYVKNKKEISK